MSPRTRNYLGIVGIIGLVIALVVFVLTARVLPSVLLLVLGCVPLAAFFLGRPGSSSGRTPPH